MPFGKRKKKSISQKRKGFWKKFTCWSKNLGSNGDGNGEALLLSSGVVLSSDSDSEVPSSSCRNSELTSVSWIKETVSADHDYGDLSGK